MTKEKIYLYILTLTLTVLGIFSANIIFAAWTEPTLSPNAGNVSAPINASTDTQSKAGPLNVATANTGLNYGLIVGEGMTRATGGLQIENTAFDPSLLVTGRIWLRTNMATPPALACCLFDMSVLPCTFCATALPPAPCCTLSGSVFPCALCP